MGPLVRENQRLFFQTGAFMHTMNNHPSKTIAAIYFAAGLTALLIAGCGSSDDSRAAGDEAPENARRVKVAASIFPLYEFVIRVGGEHIEASMIMPPGVEPHSYEPSPGDIRLLDGMDLIVMNGAGMEPWLEQIIKRAKPERAAILNASEGLDLIRAGGDDHEGHDPHDGHDHDHHHGDTNPHTWLDPRNAEQQVKTIERALTAIAPEHAADFADNARQLVAELRALDLKIETALGQCKKRDVVITHASLSYFCRRYGLNEIPISGLTHQSEPAPRALAELTRMARERGVVAVFHESEISPRLAEVVAREIGGEVLPFNNLNSGRVEDLQAGRGYVAVMEENLSNLCRGLECECGVAPEN